MSLRAILRAFVSWWHGHASAAEDAVALAVSHDREAIHGILPNGAPASPDEIAAMLASLRADQLPAIDERARRAWWLQPSRVNHLLREPGTSVHLLGLLSFHPSGYVREEAVQRLAGLHDGAELRYLLLRLNDWVPQVRQAAHAAVLERMRPDRLATFARNFILVERLERTVRADRASLLEPLAALFGTAEGHAAILEVLDRPLVRFAIEHVPSVLPAVVAAGAEAADERIRVWITPRVTHALPNDAEVLLSRLAADPSPAVRKEALTALAQSFPGAAKAHLERSLLDTSGSVREASRFLLGIPREESVGVYHRAIATASRLTSAIAGLAEVGAAPDADGAAPHLSHPRASVRRAAVKCVMRLAGDAFIERVAPMLNDPSPGVSAAARDALRRHVLSRSQLQAILAGATSPHARRNVVLLFAALPKWQSIIALLEAATDADAEAAALARRSIRDWNRQYNRAHVTPSRRELDELAAALANAEAVLDRTAVAEIRFGMSAFL